MSDEQHPPQPEETASSETPVESTQSPKPEVPNPVSPFVDCGDDPDEIDDWSVPVPMESATTDDTSELLDEYARTIHGTMSEEDAIVALRRYTTRLKDIFTGHWLKGEYEKVFQSKAMAQYIDSEKGPIRIEGQRVNMKSEMTGANAVIAMQQMMGAGRPTKIPLWHSGLVVVVGNFSEDDILTLNHLLNERRMELGYATQGYLFDGDDVNIVMEIVDFVLRHVISTNIKGWLPGDLQTLKKLMLVSDISGLLCGALDSIYPAGYPAARRCRYVDLGKCDYAPKLKKRVRDLEFDTDSLMRFNRCYWVDTNRVSLASRQHMGEGMNSQTQDKILDYQKAFNQTESLSSVINGRHGSTIRLALQVPSLERYERLGSLWVSGVMDMVDQALNNVVDGDKKTRAKKRAAFINDYAHILDLQKLAPWVKSIQFGDAEDLDNFKVCEDGKTVFNLLAELGRDRKVAKLITEETNRYQEVIQVAFTGIPNYRCPSCGESQSDHPVAIKHSIIPMDMVSYFFIIMALRLGRMAETQRGNS